MNRWQVLCKYIHIYKIIILVITQWPHVYMFSYYSTIYLSGTYCIPESVLNFRDIMVS